MLRRRYKKVLSTILAAAMVFSAAPSTTLAAQADNESTLLNETEYSKESDSQDNNSTDTEDIVNDTKENVDTTVDEADKTDELEEDVAEDNVAEDNVKEENADETSKENQDTKDTADADTLTQEDEATPVAADVEAIASPIVENTKVTFIYKDDTADKVSVAGSMNGWTPNQDMMTKNDDGNWEITFENLAPGAYEYKFVVGDSGWTTDPSNPNTSSGNSAFWITGLANAETNVTTTGKVTSLPETLKLWSLGEDNTGILSDAKVTYSLSEETLGQYYVDKISIDQNTDGICELKLLDGFPSDVSSFTLTAIDETGTYTSTVTVSVVAASYTYTIYYYDENHNSTDSAALWIWQDSGAGASEPTYFTEAETLEDGNTWLKATVTESYKDINIIPRAHDSWDWQDDTRKYTNTDGDENVTLYIMYGDGTNVYTSLPENKTIEQRYLIVEYTRDDGSAQDWYFYTWNNGYSGFYPFEKQGDKWVAKIPVKAGLEYVSYCIERANVTGDTVEHWAEKDGNDYICATPTDQNVVKIQMTQDKGTTYTFPYNKGYEIAPAEDKIHFYYRDDNAFAAGDEGGYTSVSVEINGTVYPMTFNQSEQRYTYDLDGVEPGTYNYRYILQTDTETTYAIDRFNTETITLDGNDYSVCQYDSFDIEVEASLQNTTMDYNDNNVLTVKLKSNDENADLSNMVISSATADLTALGGKVTEIEPEIMELAISVKEGTSTGEKTIPIVVYDQYKNEYKTTVTVTVTDRTKGDDFDWDEAVIYFAVTDRFFDGNSSNNGVGYDTSTETGSLSYHGGDFAGLTQKLDYLQQLGVNTIWITPIVANDMEDGLSTTLDGVKSWGYHGYWASDFTKLDSHLGTEEEFSALLDAVHARGMKLMVDVVLNHAGYNTEDYFNSQIEGVPMIRDDSQTVSGSDQQSSLSGLPDFVTENSEVRDLLVEWQSQWISKYPIDYYRVDTVKHVDDATWSEFKNALTKINPDFKLIGEWSGAGYGNADDLLGKGRMDSLLDFDFNDKAVAFVKGDITGTEDFLNKRNQTIDNTASLGAFIGSHDEDGLVFKLINNEGIDTDRAEQLQKVAASLQLTVKGQVVIYYGEEIGLYGADNYPYQTNRYDFDWSIANDDNEMLSHYKKLLAIRSDYSEVLAKGTRNTIEASNDKGLDIFERSYNGTTLTVGLNVTENAQDYTFSGLTPNATYTDLYSNTAYTADSTGSITVTIPASQDGGTVIIAKGGQSNTVVPPQEPTVDKTDDNNNNNNNNNYNDNASESETTSQQTTATTATKVKKVTEPASPVYTNLNTTTVVGWEDVIREALNDAQIKSQFLSGAVGDTTDNAGDTAVSEPSIIDITIPSGAVKPIPQNVVSVMAQSNAVYRVGIGTNVAAVLTTDALSEVTGDLDLSADVRTDIDFGFGFESFVFQPKDNTVKGMKLTYAFYLGIQNAGKPVYIFHRNPDTNAIESLGTNVIGEDGIVTLFNENYTDIFFLY